MSDSEIHFTDGAGYDAYMGPWSQSVGREFLAWLTPGAGLRWLDVGCGSGAFTELVLKTASPASVDGVDPAKDQIAYALSRADLKGARFQVGDGMSLPFADGGFDAVVMPLVIFFLPDPQTGVREMARVLSPGGTAAAYGWDLTGGGFPYEILRDELIALGHKAPMPPSPEAGREDHLRNFWKAAGFQDIETRKISVERTFAGRDDFWNIVRKGPSVGAAMAAMTPAQVAELTQRVNARLTPDATGRILCRGRANAIRGCKLK